MDAVFKNNRLYVLGLQTHLYVYDRIGNGSFVSKVNISLANVCKGCGHRELLVHNKNIYIYSIHAGEEFVS